MTVAYIIDAVRSAGGRRNGAFSTTHPADLGASVVDALIDRNTLAGDLLDDVIFGCVSQSGAQANNVARNVILASKNIPQTVPGVTVDRQCGSSQQALHFAAQAVMSGTQDLVIAGGVEVMSMVPIGSNVKDANEAGHGQPYASEGIQANYGVNWFHQTIGAEKLCERFELARTDLEHFAVESHRKATIARSEGRFANEIVAVPSSILGVDLTHDEGIREDCSIEGLAGLRTLSENGVVTAGTASQITDGASAVLIASEAAVKKYGLKPRAKVHTMTAIGDDPITMLYGPVPATEKALEKSGLALADIDLYEVNEAFAPVPMVWLKQLQADASKLNVNGGAIALGHPLGATGTKLIATLLNELERTNGRYGLLAVCEGGGTANATIIERI